MCAVLARAPVLRADPTGVGNKVAEKLIKDHEDGKTGLEVSKAVCQRIMKLGRPVRTVHANPRPRRAAAWPSRAPKSCLSSPGDAPQGLSCARPSRVLMKTSALVCNPLPHCADWRVVCALARAALHRGRSQDIPGELAAMKPNGDRTLVFVCGPPGLSAFCQGVAARAGVHFRTESFAL